VLVAQVVLAQVMMARLETVQTEVILYLIRSLLLVVDLARLELLVMARLAALEEALENLEAAVLEIRLLHPLLKVVQVLVVMVTALALAAVLAVRRRLRQVV
jgi:hypothetical protein